MGLKITKADEPITVEQIKMLVYGQPGIGKSSFAFTAEAPLMLDFDGGAHRSAFRQDIVRVSQWSDVAHVTPDDLASYSTVVIDTVGRALDFLGAHLTASDPKLGNKNGGLSLQGFGALKSTFAAWLGKLNTAGLDVIMVAHDKESTNERDVRIVRPDITGGTYHELFKLTDAVGYMYAEGKRKVLDFSPTENYVGKNPSHLEPLAIPDYTQQPDYAAKIIAGIKTALGEISVAGQQVVAEVSAFREKLDAAEDAAGVNQLLPKLPEMSKPVKVQCWALVQERAGQLGLAFDKESKRFHAAEAAE